MFSETAAVEEVFLNLVGAGKQKEAAATLTTYAQDRCVEALRLADEDEPNFICFKSMATN
jgi:hypothetical protein